MSMDARTGEEHNELIFSHEGNARAAASVILIGVIAALIGSVFNRPEGQAITSSGQRCVCRRCVGAGSYRRPDTARQCSVRPAGLAEYRSALSCPLGARARSRQYIVTCAHQQTLAAACTNDNSSTAVTGPG